MSWADPFGCSLSALLIHGACDRARGISARANARWGWVTPPAAAGRPIWIAAGQTRDSVLLGVELTRALREKRLDIRLVLTFEEEYPDLLARLDGLPKTGWGYACCDHPRALRRIFERLQPLGVIFAGVAPRPNLARACGIRDHVLAVNPPHNAPRSERVYPVHECTAGSADNHAAAVDLLCMLVEAQVDPNFKSLVTGNTRRYLWRLHGGTAGEVGAFALGFRQLFPEDVLFISAVARLPDIEAKFEQALRISAWQRDIIGAGTVVWVDEAIWLPAIAASVNATHFLADDRLALWQAMAVGGAVSCAHASALPKDDFAVSLVVGASIANVLETWRQYRENVILARSRADALHRRFWQERRLAAQVADELLQRVFDW
ncbi:MAG: hypothetical protein ACREUA_03425 [Burkholderiales bacterium]